MTDSIRLDTLPHTAHERYASDRATLDPTFELRPQDAFPLSLEDNETPAIYRSALERLFDFPQGPTPIALFPTLPVEKRLSPKLFADGKLSPLPLAQGELDWEEERPTRPSLQKLLKLSETIEVGSDEEKVLAFLELELFLERLGLQVFTESRRHRKG